MGSASLRSRSPECVMARGQGGIRSPIDFLTEIFVGPASRRSPSFGNSRIAAAFSSLRSAHWCRALVSCHSFTSVVRTCFRTYRKRAMGREGFSIRVAPHIPIRHMCRRATCVSLLPVRIQTGRYTYQRFTDAATMVTFVNGGQGGIRTPEGECQQIYSLPRLTASVPTHGAVARSRQAEPGPAVPETATTHNAALLPPLQPLRGVEPRTYSLPLTWFRLFGSIKPNITHKNVVRRVTACWSGRPVPSTTAS